MAPRWSKMTQDSSKMAEEGPRWVPGSASEPLGIANMAALEESRSKSHW